MTQCCLGPGWWWARPGPGCRSSDRRFRPALDGWSGTPTPVHMRGVNDRKTAVKRHAHVLKQNDYPAPSDQRCSVLSYLKRCLPSPSPPCSCRPCAERRQTSCRPRRNESPRTRCLEEITQEAMSRRRRGTTHMNNHLFSESSCTLTPVRAAPQVPDYLVDLIHLHAVEFHDGPAQNMKHTVTDAVCVWKLC